MTKCVSAEIAHSLAALARLGVLKVVYAHSSAFAHANFFAAKATAMYIFPRFP
jgi:hypothetical protein